MLHTGAVVSFDVVTHPKKDKMNFGYVAIETHSVVSEGMNEAGLTVSCHTLRTSEYQRYNTADERVEFFLLAPKLLSTFATVGEAIWALRNEFRVVGEASEEAYIHWGIHDALGQAAVIEYIKGELHVHNHTEIGIMTNDPPYDFHLYHLNSFAGFSNKVHKGVNTVNSEFGQVPRYISHGQNLFGVPGDFGPPSRFVRTFLLKQLAMQAIPLKSMAKAVNLVEHLINSVDIPRGSVGPKSDNEPNSSMDFAQWSCIKLPSARVFYVRTYMQTRWRKFDLKKLNLKKSAQSKRFRLIDEFRHYTDDDDDSNHGLDAIDAASDLQGFDHDGANGLLVD